EGDSDQAEFTACCSGSDDDDQDLNEDDPSPALDTGFGNTIIVDTRPVIRTKKHDKLRGVIREICSRMGVIKEDGGGVSMPYMNVPDEWAGPPETKPYVPGENLQLWLTDEMARDQFVIRSGSDTEVLWNDARHLKPEPVYKRQVKLMDFSPGERFLVTYSSHEPSNPGDTHLLSSYLSHVWVSLSFADGVAEKMTSILPELVENVMDISWSPTDPILALFVPELGEGNQPARVSLIQIPGKDELRQKNLFSVSDCKMYWQSSGEYLAVKVDRFTKTKKSTYTGFELFRIKERDIPLSTHNAGRVSKLTTLKGKPANALYWSPAGRFILLAGLKGFNGQLEFYNVDELETMATSEHFMATDVEWDPTGRYVATSVTSVHEMENEVQAEDQDVSLLLSMQDHEKRKMLKEEWERMVNKWKRLHEEEKSERQWLRDEEASDGEEEYEAREVEVEEFLDVSDEVPSFE
ncbi:hypothetical protein C3L33_12014, partial [Rhododendron williamsianum]